MKAQRCKGTRDLLPQAMRRFRYIEEIFRTSCLRWGYGEVRTPILEYLYLFTAAGTLTPKMLSRVYSFLDWDGWSGERVVLRPDGTIPTARLFLSELSQEAPARLFYVANTFSFEETGTEARERWQCGAELIGGGPPVADVELVLLALEVLKRLGLEGVRVRLAHIGLLRALLGALRLEAAQQTEVLDQVLDGNIRALEEIRPFDAGLQGALSLLFGLKGESPGFLRNLGALLVPTLPEVEPSVQDFLQVAELLTALGCPYEIDMASGKGFEYYTGLVFQFYLGEEKVGGGGRYDNLIPLLGGEDVPASGFALYMEPLMKLAAPPREMAPARRVLVTVEPGAPWKSGFHVAQELRAAGYGVELDLGGARAADLVWQVLVPQGEGASYLLVDLKSGKRVQLSSLARLLGALEETIEAGSA